MSVRPNIQRIILLPMLILAAAILAAAQDRDITSGSSSGSIRPDVLDTNSGPRTRMLTPRKRGEMVAEFDSFRGAEKLLGVSSFEAVKQEYRSQLEKLAAERPIVSDLTPVKYLVFEIMARELADNHPGTSPQNLADSLMSSYVKTKSFMKPILAGGITPTDAKQAEHRAVAAIKKLRRN